MIADDWLSLLLLFAEWRGNGVDEDDQEEDEEEDTGVLSCLVESTLRHLGHGGGKGRETRKDVKLAVAEISLDLLEHAKTKGFVRPLFVLEANVTDARVPLNVYKGDQPRVRTPPLLLAVHVLFLACG